jgi:hypothetical protein
MLEYKIVKDKDLKTLVAFINLQIEDGWSLQGGLAVEGHSGFGVSTYYLQAMVKEKDDQQWNE